MEKILAGRGLGIELDHLIKETAPDGQISYLVARLDDERAMAEIAGRGLTTVHASASMIKVLIMAALFAKVADGDLALDMTVKLSETPKVLGGGALQELESNHRFSYLELCRLMMVLSDNWATNLLITKLGMDYVNEFAKSLGLHDTRLNRYMMDSKARAEGRENVMTVLDLMTLYEYIYSQRETGPLGREMWQLLGRQQFRDKLPFYWGEDVVFHHKTGVLDDVEHDGGLLPLVKGTFSIIVFISKVPNTEGILLGARMGRCIKDFLENKLP
ncbi:serine hydrolase [Veillonella seminalis]|uniref:Serine hydrolase n=1 Tax=Veillonella seminalis TaxID=1502943 RepID=A0A833CAJ4_9FIRM|nr:serine hydrolase [Veillonella seminalis]KAB1477323.1 serine hydrolase [Veillonella seminalis]